MNALKKAIVAKLQADTTASTYMGSVTVNGQTIKGPFLDAAPTGVWNAGPYCVYHLMNGGKNVYLMAKAYVEPILVQLSLWDTNSDTVGANIEYVEKLFNGQSLTLTGDVFLVAQSVHAPIVKKALQMGPKTQDWYHAWVDIRFDSQRTLS
jgi:hypothetical protein